MKKNVGTSYFKDSMNLLQRFDSRLRNAVSVETHQCSVYI